MPYWKSMTLEELKVMTLKELKVMTIKELKVMTLKELKIMVMVNSCLHGRRYQLPVYHHLQGNGSLLSLAPKMQCHHQPHPAWMQQGESRSCQARLILPVLWRASLKVNICLLLFCCALSLGDFWVICVNFSGSEYFLA